MTADEQDWMNDWTVGVHLWVERAGQAILGPGRLELLETIDRCHSISAAARQLGMSYRRAWLLVESINRAAGTKLVRTQTGGRDGGGTELTPQGRLAAKVFRELQARFQRTAAAPLLSPPEADIVHVAAATSLEEVLPRLLAEFALHHPTISVRSIYGASDEVANHVLNGLHVDLFLSAEARQVDRLSAAGAIAPETRVILAANRLVAVGLESRTLRLSGPRGLLQAGVKRIALADPSCPLGNYTRSYLEPLGLWPDIRRQALFLDNPRVVLAAVQSGQADVGLVYHSDAVASVDCRILFRSRAAQPSICYTAALTRRGEVSPSAVALLTFLSSVAAQQQFRRAGFLSGEPPLRERDR
jgi:molybdenum ABC transporter molybdate-binding protein